MPKVICTLKNASALINGVKFVSVEGGAMLSENVSEEVAERFVSIPGYELAPSAAAIEDDDGEGDAKPKTERRQKNKEKTASVVTPADAPQAASSPASVFDQPASDAKGIEPGF